MVFQPEIDNIYFKLFSNGRFWLALLFLPIIAIIPDATIKYFRMLYFPTTSDLALSNKAHLGEVHDTESELMEVSKSNKSSTKKPDTLMIRSKAMDEASDRIIVSFQISPQSSLGKYIKNIDISR